jgi:hypothetical protein
VTARRCGSTRSIFRHAKISDIRGVIGSRGKRTEVAAKQGGADGLEKVLALEVYDDFPKAAFLTITYRNAGRRPSSWIRSRSSGTGSTPR